MGRADSLVQLLGHRSLFCQDKPLLGSDASRKVTDEALDHLRSDGGSIQELTTPKRPGFVRLSPAGPVVGRKFVQ